MKYVSLLQPKVLAQTKASIQILQFLSWNLNLGFRLKTWVPALMASLMITINDLTLQVGCHYASFTSSAEFLWHFVPKKLACWPSAAFLLIRSLAKREDTIQPIYYQIILINYSLKATKKKKSRKNLTFIYHKSL